MNRSNSTLAILGIPATVLFACSGNGGSAPGGATTSPDASISDASSSSLEDSTSPSDASVSAPDGWAMTVAGARTFALDMTRFTLAPGEEVFKCQDFANPVGDDMAIVSIASEMKAGSHHLFVFMLPDLVDTAIGECPYGGLEFHDFIHATQAPNAVVSYPRGVGRVVNRNVGFRMNAHFLNASSVTVDASVHFEAAHVPVDSIEHPAYSIVLNNVSFRAPVGRSTVEDSFQLPYSIELLAATSHMHRWGTHFIASTEDGTVLLETSNSQEPSVRTFEPPREISGGTSIRWACTFENDTSSVLTFGQSAAKNEMCIFAGYFYAKAEQAADLEGS